MKFLQKKKNIFFIVIIGILFLMILMRWHVVHSSKDYIIPVDEFSRVSNCQNVVILGSRVHENGKMSGILQERAMAAVDLYNQNKVCSILISGDSFGKNGSDYDEISPVKDFLIMEGIESEIIITDGEGFDTFASIKNSRDKLGYESALIVTQEFHLSRAVYIARALGMNAEGYTAYKYPYQNKMEKWRNYLRELPAAVKAIFEVNFRD